jgi:hypothetical protein
LSLASDSNPDSNNKDGAVENWSQDSTKKYQRKKAEDFL